MLQLGDDKWSLAGTTKIPKQRPEVVCRYGWVKCGDTGVAVARAVAFQLYDRELDQQVPVSCVCAGTLSSCLCSFE